LIFLAINFSLQFSFLLLICFINAREKTVSVSVRVTVALMSTTSSQIPHIFCAFFDILKKALLFKGFQDIFKICGNAKSYAYPQSLCARFSLVSGQKAIVV